MEFFRKLLRTTFLICCFLLLTCKCLGAVLNTKRAIFEIGNASHWKCLSIRNLNKCLIFRNLPSDHSYFQLSGHSGLPAVTLSDIQKPPIWTSSEPSTPSAGAEKAAVTDDRRCLFCGSEGDEEEEEGAGRLLYFRCVCVCVCVLYMCFSTVSCLFFWNAASL